MATENWWYNSPKDGQRHEKKLKIDRYEWFQLSSLSGREKRMGLGWHIAYILRLVSYSDPSYYVSYV